MKPLLLVCFAVLCAAFDVHAWDIVHDPTSCAKMVQMLRQGYDTYRTLQGIQYSLADPKCFGVNLVRRAWDKFYWDQMVTKDKSFLEALGAKKRKKVVCLYEQDRDGVYQPVWTTDMQSSNPDAYTRHTVHRATFEHCQDVLESTQDRRKELQEQQRKILKEMEGCKDQLSIQKKQAELAAVQSELNTLQAVENASVNNVLARNAENQNQEQLEEKAKNEAIDRANQEQKNRFAQKFKDVPFRKRFKEPSVVAVLDKKPENLKLESNPNTKEKHEPKK